jgi:hypothetical protein
MCQHPREAAYSPPARTAEPWKTLPRGSGGRRGDLAMAPTMSPHPDLVESLTGATVDSAPVWMIMGCDQSYWSVGVSRVASVRVRRDAGGVREAG